jgi:hydrogenase/urease accessory protein HupE
MTGTTQSASSIKAINYLNIALIIMTLAIALFSPLDLLRNALIIMMISSVLLFGLCLFTPQKQRIMQLILSVIIFAFCFYSYFYNIESAKQFFSAPAANQAAVVIIAGIFALIRGFRSGRKTLSILMAVIAFLITVAYATLIYLHTTLAIKLALYVFAIFILFISLSFYFRQSNNS